MSNQVSFPFRWQPKGMPSLTYEGPTLITNHMGPQTIKIRSDRLFTGMDGCMELCSLVSATINGRSVFRELTADGHTHGNFDFNGSGVSLWSFEINFRPSRLIMGAGMEGARDADSAVIHRTLRLTFEAICAETIPRAVTPRLETTRPEEVFPETRTLTYRPNLVVDIFVQHRLVQNQSHQD